MTRRSISEALTAPSRAVQGQVEQPLKVEGIPRLPDSPRSWDPHRLLGLRLRRARELAGWSRTIAARELGVSYQQYQKYEEGLNRISAVALYRLAVAWNTDMEWFCVGEQDQQEREILARARFYCPSS